MLLGIDYGTAKIGLAVCDTSKQAIPLALSIIRYKNNAYLRKELSKIIEDYSVDTFVVGYLPEEKAGDDHKKERFKQFISLLETYSFPIKYADEQRTTQAAKSLGRDNPNFNTKNDDALAAQVILENYLATDGRSQN